LETPEIRYFLLFQIPTSVAVSVILNIELPVPLFGTLTHSYYEPAMVYDSSVELLSLSSFVQTHK